MVRKNQTELMLRSSQKEDLSFVGEILFFYEIAYACTSCFGS